MVTPCHWITDKLIGTLPHHDVGIQNIFLLLLGSDNMTDFSFQEISLLSALGHGPVGVVDSYSAPGPLHREGCARPFVLWLIGELRVCSLSSWDSTSLPTRQPPIFFLPSLPIRNLTHTQISSFHHLLCILIAAISLLWQCESQPFPGWPFLRKQTSGDTILNCLTFSIQFLAARVVLLQSISFWDG